MKVFKRILVIFFALVILVALAAIIWKEQLIRAILPEMVAVDVKHALILNDSARISIGIRLANKPYIK